MERGKPIKRLVAGLGLAALLVTATAACTRSPDLPTPVSPAPAPGPTSNPDPDLDPEDLEAWTEVQALFDGLLEVWIKWAAEGIRGGHADPAIAELGSYATTRYMAGEVYGELVEEVTSGQVRTGRPQWQHTRLVSVDWEHQPADRAVPELVFEVCMDDSDWVVVDAATGEPEPGEPGGRHVWSVTAWWVEERDSGPDGWALYQHEVDRSQSC